LIIHGDEGDEDDKDEHDDTENVFDEMEDINAMRLKAVTLDIVLKMTL